MEKRVFTLGAWKNFEDLEESLSLPELSLLALEIYDTEFKRNKFAAALKGIKIDDEKDDLPSYQDIEKRAQAKIAAEKTGKTEEQIQFADLGIAFIQE